MGAGNLPRFQHPSQYGDESSSVSSQKTYPYLNSSQCDMHLAIKSEVSEILRTFTSLSSQQYDSIQSSILTPASDPQSRQCAISSSLSHSLNLAPVLDANAELWSRAKTDFSHFLQRVTASVSTLTQEIATVRTENECKGISVMERATNIEKVLEARVGKKKKGKPAGKKKVCTCLLEAGKLMTKAERNRAVKEGKLVCTCKV